MANVLTYAPKDVTIVLCGYTLTGILGVELQFNSRPFTLHKGIRGVTTRVYSTDSTAKLVLEVQQTSVTNDILSQILIQDARNKSARLDLTVKDTGGSTVYDTTQGFIPTIPSLKFSQGFENRVWEIEILKLNSVFLGGNASAGFDILSSVQGAVDFLSGAATEAVDTIESNLPIF